MYRTLFVLLPLLLSGCADGPSAPAGPASLRVTPATALLVALGDTVRYVAEVRDRRGNLVSGVPITWTSDDTTVATIGATSGLVRSVDVGGTTIRATAGTLVGAANITVEQRADSVFLLPADTTVLFSDVIRYRVVLKDRAGNVFVKPPTWTNANTNVVGNPVNNAVRALGAGTTTLRITVDGRSADATVTVNPLEFADVQGGGYGACGLTTTGRAFCWGRIALGDSTTLSSTGPRPVAGGLRFASLRRSMGLNSSFGSTCGLSPAGEAWCWGVNEGGQLGNGGTEDAVVPTRVSGSLRFASLAVGAYHVCGLTADGTAYCWGDNSTGALGDGGTVSRPAPGPVSGGLRFTVLTAGERHTCGLVADGTAYCWGSGPLGDPDVVQLESPAPVESDVRFTQISSGHRHVCALIGNGAAYCWGAGGLTGNGETSTGSQPLPVVGGHVFHSISAGLGSTCALPADGAPLCWGGNLVGELGVPAPPDGGVDQALSPIRTTAATAYSALSVGGGFVCGRRQEDARYSCWGSNLYGELGAESTAMYTFLPVLIKGQSP